MTLEKRIFQLLLALLFTPYLTGQTVVVDWVGKTLVSSPAKINQKTSAQIEVQNVNDVLYKYSVQVAATPRVDDDFSTIAQAFVPGKAAGEGAPDPCTDLVKAVQNAATALGTAVTAFYQTPVTGAKCSKSAPCSIDIADTRTAWTSGITPQSTSATNALTALQAVPICKKTYSNEITSLQTALTDVNDKHDYLFADNHSVLSQTTLDPDTDYTINVKEMYLGAGSSTGTQTTAPTLSIKFSPATDRLTLSAGVLLSEIQNRGYSSQAEPNSTNSGTQNVLVVSGISTFSPLALGLLNYEIPSFKKLSFGNDNIGLAVSTGPVLRIGTKSDSASFGYFAGVSVHMYHRFYISPGVHFGQFADFPPGFTKAGQLIPTGLGTPTAVNRYTARFSFGITYKTKDFSGLGLTASAKATPSTTASPTKPATPTPKPVN
jgi:hypothetical protein